MSDYEILQIIPSPPGAFVQYRGGSRVFQKVPLVCLALIQHIEEVDENDVPTSTWESVEGMVCSGRDGIETAQDACPDDAGFDGVFYSRVDE